MAGLVCRLPVGEGHGLAYGLWFGIASGLGLCSWLGAMAGLVCRLPVGEGHGLAYGLWFGIASGLGFSSWLGANGGAGV